MFALGLAPNSGPGLIFATLPKVFAAIPAGWLFGLLFFIGLFGAGYLSGIAAFEVLVAALTDNTRLSRQAVVWLVAGVAFLIAIPPMINNQVFIPWDLTFGSGMQTLGALVAAVTVGWAMNRGDAIRALSEGGAAPGAELAVPVDSVGDPRCAAARSASGGSSRMSFTSLGACRHSLSTLCRGSFAPVSVSGIKGLRALENRVSRL